MMVLFWWQFNGLEDFERSLYDALIDSLRDYISALEAQIHTYELFIITVITVYCIASLYLLISLNKRSIKKRLYSIIKWFKKW